VKSQIICAPFRDDIEIKGDEVILMEPEILANEPLHTVPRHRVANLAASGDPDPGMAGTVLRADNDEMGRMKLLS